ncbi:MAG: CPBP family intramembrane metalloprotease, partial [Bacteroidales bacterium]|nr:CPBP family intramembrane metalloprotease [Bacteroidales bacterium]
LPAILEEWFFRGVLQRLFISWTKRVWVGLILASTVFSLIHFDLPNFFARFVLGMMLGMLYLYSGNIWTNITYHFINNAAAAISMWYCARQGGGCSDGFDFPVIVSIVSALAVVACVVYCIRKLRPDAAFDELLTANEPMVETEGETMTEL